MKARRVIFTILSALLAGSFFTGCDRVGVSHPAASLQRAISARLADPGSCPPRGSQDVKQAIEAVGPDGVVRLPEGCYRITTTVIIPPGIKLVGAGADRTILFRDPQDTFSQPILKVQGVPIAPGGTQISGLSLVGVRNTEDTGQDYGITLSGVPGFRIDHCYFEGFGFAGIRINGTSNGVIDHDVFIDNFKKGIDNLGYGVVVYGANQWLDDPQPGGSQATFVEDSLFVGNRHSIAASAGAHYVFRYNQVLGGVEACGVDAHGMGYGSSHGTRYVEIYQNVIDDPEDNWCGIGIRGGAGVIFKNTIRGYQNPVLLILEWGTPENLKESYPALDQVRDLYIWDNGTTTGLVDPRVDETGKGFIEVGRDYFVQPKPGYSPFQYPHPLADGGPFDSSPWPPSEKVK